MSEPPARSPAGPAITERNVAKGAGAALLGHAGGVIEVVSPPVYVWMFGLATSTQARRCSSL